MKLSDFLHLLSCIGLVDSVSDGRWLLVMFTKFPLADDAFLLNHSLETLDGFLQRLVLFYSYKCHITHPLCQSRLGLSEIMPACLDLVNNQDLIIYKNNLSFCAFEDVSAFL